MKKLLSVIMALALCATPVFAAETPERETMPAAWLDPIRCPKKDTVTAIYRYDKMEGEIDWTSGKPTIDTICDLLGNMKAQEVILNVPDVSFVPVRRTPGEVILELRTTDGVAMRYYLENGGTIISQRIEEGMMYQGMKFIGGNTAQTVQRLREVTGYQMQGETALELPILLKDIYLYNYRDMTCTRIIKKLAKTEVEDSLYSLFDTKNRCSDNTALGERLIDVHDLVLTLEDGTDVTVALYEKGAQVLQQTDSLNAPESVVYEFPTTPYRHLQSILRYNQSACTPIWLYAMPQDRITAISLTDMQSKRSVTLHPGDADYDMLLEISTGLVVEPLSMEKLTRRSYPDTGYEIKFTLNDDNVCTVNFTADTVEVEHSAKEYIAAYHPAKGAPFGLEDMAALIEVISVSK